jgi:DNA-binding response OmpR family regulator
MAGEPVAGEKMNASKIETKRVLVCDDELPITRLLQASLERQGHSVVVAHDGREALEAIAEREFDVIVLDWLMPYVDGLEVLRKIRSSSRHKDVKVVMLSTLAQDADIVEGTQAGADHYLTKPFNPNELYGLIADL